ncbi:hypothetical protein RHMOL_Rhmol13G0285300 [Rhododendron molle]|uniref:Uncharacterized protein n=1 Tax=Rhododendron molle TaxID=49168 RepID=A0ACC0LBN8_RHOML|nr:hypothetical protein RHMOL_Rhmol13G0285300 [Rhododendron molle]
MDSSEATKTVFSRIQSLDPENATKIMGYVFIQDHGEEEMIRLAFGPETLLLSLINQAKTHLGLLSNTSSTTPSTPSSPSLFNPIRPNPFPHSTPRIVIPNNGFHSNPSSPSGFSGFRNPNGVSGSFSPSTRSSFSLPQFYSNSNYSSNLSDEYNTLQNQLSFLDDPDADFVCFDDRGFGENVNSCKKLLHGGFGGCSPEGKVNNGFDEFLRMKAVQQQRFAAASQLMMGRGPFPYNKCVNFVNDSPRSASAALVMGEEFHSFGRHLSERSDFSVMGFEGSADSVSRQIYLTFPADSTFLEEDVSNYFSKFGPVQDVRIPYQQKRMFGFVSFVYPETVNIILAKGNPHFVCDSRVLVKPYKEKGKVPDKNHRQRQLERGGSFDSLEPYDLPVGPRMFSNSKEMLRRKLEQVELQQAIELQGRRMMNFQLSELKNHHHGHQFQQNRIPGIPIPSPAPPHLRINQSHLLRSNSFNQEILEDSNSSAAADSPTVTADQKQEIKEACDDSNDNGDNNDSLEHILPDNLFASPRKSGGDHRSVFSTSSAEADDSTSATTTSSPSNSPMLPDSSTLNIATQKSCYF